MMGRTTIKFALSFGQEVIPITANVPTSLFFNDRGELNICKLQNWLNVATVVCQPTRIEIAQEAR
jgi:hypothetical protein